LSHRSLSTWLPMYYEHLFVVGILKKYFILVRRHLAAGDTPEKSGKTKPN